MFYGYPISQWIEVVEWLLLMIILFTGTFVVSCILTNKFLHKNKKNKLKNKKTKKEKLFYRCGLKIINMKGYELL